MPQSVDKAHKRTGSLPQRPAFNISQASHKTSSKSNPTAQSIAHSSALQNQEFLESTLELAQLHIIHSKAALTQAEWAESARRALEKQHDELMELKRSLDERDRADAMQRNAKAIVSWMNRAGSDTLHRRIKVISKVLDDFWQLTSLGGRYVAVVEAFEHWYDAATEPRSEHERQGGGEEFRTRQVTVGLGDGWKAEVDSLQDKLVQAAQDILSLGDIDPDAELARCIALLSEMTHNMLEELEALLFIEQSLVLQEQFWMQASLDHLTHYLQRTQLFH